MTMQSKSRFKLGLPLVIAATAASLVGGWISARSATGATPAADTVDFVRDVQPILAKHCYECHSARKQKGGLRLDSKSHAFLGGDSGHKPITPGDPKSRMLQLVRGDDPQVFMPAKGERLTPAEVDVLTKWIVGGANWPDTGAPVAEQTHWSFKKPVRLDPPAVKLQGWTRNAIDNFVLARLEKEGLKPSPEADKYALCRRVHLDLIGLPPTPAEVDQFVNDSAPDAYEKLVDRLLANPHFGERWARVWLDLARYADSAGYGSDPLRFTSWRFRDWVIEAFNKNQPYDQFTVEQLAGDLLPNPTTDQLIATGFHRNTQTNTEGGTDDEEWRVAAVKDRASTTMQVWMGLTMQCAECHTHKYDPITNREYYQFTAFFNNTADNDQPDESPTIEVPTADQQQQIAKVNADIAKVKAQMDDPTTLAAKQAEWEKTALPTDAAWRTIEPASMTSAGGATLTKQPDGSILASGTRANTDTYTINATTDLKGITAFKIEALPDASLPAGGPGRADNGNFVLTDFRVAAGPKAASAGIKGRFVRIENPGNLKMLHLAEVQVYSGAENIATKGKASQSSTGFNAPAQRAIDGNTDGDYHHDSVSHTNEEANPWWEVDLGQAADVSKIVLWSRVDGNFQSRLNGIKLLVLADDRKPAWETVIPVAPQVSLEIDPAAPTSVTLSNASDTFHQSDGPQWPAGRAIDADAGENSGWAIAPQFGKPNVAVFETTREVGDDAGSALKFTLVQNLPIHSLGRFRISATASARPIRVLPAGVTLALALPIDKRSDAQKAEVTEYFKTVDPRVAAGRDQIAKLQASIGSIKPVRQAVMRELPPNQRRTSYMLLKGNFAIKGDVVEPRVPESFHAYPKDAPANRLGLAQWIVSPENPLTARVAVNRWWGQIFGLGLVETQEDFGTQGQPPSHPELLDWLATEYVRVKWDTKAMLKEIVTSATYRQSSKQTPELIEKDNRNRLLARGPRGRLEAELVRDEALALSGLLSEKMLGPSVYPPQPPNLWQAAFNGERTYPTSTGEDKYRRGLYTFWRRTTPYPSMAAFDAPSREICTLRRISTSTPLQAFVTLNDPVYVEFAQALGRRIVKEGGATPEARIRYALKLCLARPATDAQVAALTSLFQSEAERYKLDKAAAMQMATEPIGALPAGADAAEMAAWTVVGNVLLNMDGVLSKG